MGANPRPAGGPNPQRTLAHAHAAALRVDHERIDREFFALDGEPVVRADVQVAKGRGEVRAPVPRGRVRLLAVPAATGAVRDVEFVADAAPLHRVPARATTLMVGMEKRGHASKLAQTSPPLPRAPLHEWLRISQKGHPM